MLLSFVFQGDTALLILNRKEIEDLADLKDVIEAVEEAFLEVSRQTAICPKRLIIGVKNGWYSGSWR